jgi:hypothetical protein
MLLILGDNLPEIAGSMMKLTFYITLTRLLSRRVLAEASVYE